MFRKPRTGVCVPDIPTEKSPNRHTPPLCGGGYWAIVRRKSELGGTLTGASVDVRGAVELLGPTFDVLSRCEDAGSRWRGAVDGFPSVRHRLFRQRRRGLDQIPGLGVAHQAGVAVSIAVDRRRRRGALEHGPESL